jgi:hypothetical protein
VVYLFASLLLSPFFCHDHHWSFYTQLNLFNSFLLNDAWSILLSLTNFNWETIDFLVDMRDFCVQN